jgi:type VI secretion system secreted protein VgrG
LAQNVNLIVKIGGNNYSPVSYCSINQLIDWHHSFEIVLPVDGYTKNNNTILNQVKDFIGKKIEISFKISGAAKSNIQNEFYGIITEICLNRQKGGSKEILVRGYSPTIMLDGRTNCRSYVEKTLNDLVTIIHGQIPQNDLTINCNPVFTDEIPYIVQYKESNFHFLNRIADNYGEWCFYNGKELNFGKIKKSNKTDLPVDKELSDFDFSIKILNINNKSFTYDYLENKTYSKETKNFQVNDLDPYGDHAMKQSEKAFKQENIHYSSGYFNNERDFSSKTETKKIEKTKDLITANGVSDNPYINVGTVINIKGGGTKENDFGEFIIISINHTIDVSGNYVNHFTAIPAQANVPPVNRNIASHLPEIQPAVVKDNDDPEKLGRIKVQFFWQDNADETPWIRVLQPYGGKLDGSEQHGFYFIPEIGDEVMIGFENDNPDKPFIIGNVYHKNSKPDHWNHAQNNIKSIRTRSGNQIIFIDENGKEEIRILNKDDQSPTNEISLSLNNNGIITIKSIGDLEISGKSIKISAQNDIIIDSGQSTKLTANDYQLDANNGIQLKGQQLNIEGTNTSMKGQTELKLEGAQTKIEATVLKMEGTGQAELKGALVKVEATGITTIKGSLVQIN